MEIHHIDPDGSNDEENGIPLCFDCHAEVMAYDPSHPKGRKFTPSELRRHKNQWLAQCSLPPFTANIFPGVGETSLEDYQKESEQTSLIKEDVGRIRNEMFHQGSLPNITDEYIQGFILNELYCKRIFFEPENRRSGRYITSDNLMKGFLPMYRKKSLSNINLLRKNNIIRFLHPKRGSRRISAILTKDAIEKGLILVNKYRLSAGLPELNYHLIEKII